MKKVITILLSLILCIVLLTGCSKNNSNEGEKNNNNEESQSEFPYLTVDAGPFTVTPKDGYDNSGITTYICNSTNDYKFEAKESEGIYWSVYLLNEKYKEDVKSIPETLEATLKSDGTIIIEEGTYIYIYCSANALTVESMPEGPSLEITRIEKASNGTEEVSYETLVEFLKNGFTTKWENTRPESQGLSSIFNNLSEYTGYTIKDINSDGTEELVIGENLPDTNFTVIYNIFAKNENNEIVQLANGDERDRFYLCNDGIIVEEGSNSVEDSIKKVYTLEKGNLVESAKQVTENDYIKIDLEVIYK